jgi:hypothetical protein
MNIDQPRTDNEPAGVDRFIGFALQLAGSGNLGDAAVFEEHVVLALEVLGGIDESAAANSQTTV